MAFSEEQVKALSGKLSAKHVRTREADGVMLSYVEGWHAIAEANRIFGFDAWDRETLATKCVWEGMRQGRDMCDYIARVRIRVRSGNITISRDGSGSGHGAGLSRGQAHENALKAAETDAMKRALATFGNPFGLALYDKELRGVRGAIGAEKKPVAGRGVRWIVVSSNGDLLSKHTDPATFCAALRKELQAAETESSIMLLWGRNAVTVEMLRQILPKLKTDKGDHFADILVSLYEERLRDLRASTPLPSEQLSSNAEGRPPIGESVVMLPTPRRLRNKDHLKYVATQPCIVCGRVPSQAHHVTFAQPKALGRKVGDDFAVALCATHHRALHAVGDERKWWKRHNVDPLPEAERLWSHTRDIASAEASSKKSRLDQ